MNHETPLAQGPVECRVGLQRPCEITVWRDEQAELLDDMADLCEYWKRNRGKGRTPNAIRRALVKAGALILAEIERLDRLEPQPVSEMLRNSMISHDYPACAIHRGGKCTCDE